MLQDVNHCLNPIVTGLLQLHISKHPFRFEMVENDQAWPRQVLL